MRGMSITQMLAMAALGYGIYKLVQRLQPAAAGAAPALPPMPAQYWPGSVWDKPDTSGASVDYGPP